jgi:hypothetical protein
MSKMKRFMNYTKEAVFFLPGNKGNVGVLIAALRIGTLPDRGEERG